MKLAVLEHAGYEPVYNAGNVTIFRHKSQLERSGFAAREAVLIAASMPLHGFRYVFRLKATDPQLNILNLPGSGLAMPAEASNQGERKGTEDYVDNLFLNGIDESIWEQHDAETLIQSLPAHKDIVVIEPYLEKHMCMSDLIHDIQRFDYYRTLDCILARHNPASSLFGPVIARFESMFGYTH